MGQIEYTVADEDGDFDVEARCGGKRIGYAWGIRDDDRLNLTDLHVEEDRRRQGIGHELLVRILREADTAGIRLVWGSVTTDDLRNFPTLLIWYEKNGFVVHEPDAECLKGAAKKIVREVK